MTALQDGGNLPINKLKSPVYARIEDFNQVVACGMLEAEYLCH